MIKYPDSEGKELRKGFYGFAGSENLFYFTGKYDKKTGFPLFEKENELGNEKGIPIFLIRRIYGVEKEVVRDRYIKLKKKAAWLERRLNE